MADDTANGKHKSDLILDDIRKRKEKKGVVDVEEKRVKVVIFSLQGEAYAFYGDFIKEILPPMTIFPVPGSADFIPGVINVRGQIESVININRFLDIPVSANAQGNRIALAVSDGIRSGILVDSLEDVVDIPAGSIKPPLDTLSKAVKEFVAGVFTHQGQIVALLDIVKIFEKITV